VIFCEYLINLVFLIGLCCFVVCGVVLGDLVKDQRLGCFVLFVVVF
jgi:hypothetical protein